ncbi:MAG: NAD(P)H-binding protein [Cyanobacteria bacterium HKST-UBA02]|nr:NAD(P)H-binding protein [Cyanobacteria bacterium HKST-UBA02]
MNITITGGTGFLGGHLIRHLVRRNQFPTVIARGVSKKAELIRRIPNINFMPIPLTDDSKLFHAFRNCEAVAHLAGINHESGKSTYKEVHVEATVRILHAARKAGIKKILYVSYLKARPRCLSAYHESKWEAEELIRKSGMDYTILKPGMIYGPGDQMITQIARALDTSPFFSPVSSFGIIEPGLRPVAVDDMVRIMAAALLESRLSRKTVAVLGPERLTLSQIVRRIARVKRKMSLVLPMPVMAHMVLAGLNEAAGSPGFLPTMAQVRMLAEGMDEVPAGCDELPENLQPELFLTDDLIKEALI